MEERSKRKIAESTDRRPEEKTGEGAKARPEGKTWEGAETKSEEKTGEGAETRPEGKIEESNEARPKGKIGEGTEARLKEKTGEATEGKAGERAGAGNILTAKSDGMHFDAYQDCCLCPRMCGANRYESAGFCRAGTQIRAARAALHLWEEPCISGRQGSGAVFFSNCTLRCVFCQNDKISAQGFGKELSERELADVFLRLQDEGAANIDLITATHYLPGVLRALELVRHKLHIPVVYNCGGYERAETIRMLDGYIDIYLPDLKYSDAALARRCSAAADYADAAFPAIREMLRQCGVPGISAEEIAKQPGGLLKRGVIIRHMVLPGQRQDSIRLLRRMKEELPQGTFLLSLMSQYTPCYLAKTMPELKALHLDRRLTSYEYGKVLDEALRLGFDGYLQERTSAKEEYTPPFDLEGL